MDEDKVIKVYHFQTLNFIHLIDTWR